MTFDMNRFRGPRSLHESTRGVDLGSPMLEEDKMYRSILVPLDGSATAEHALPSHDGRRERKLNPARCVTIWPGLRRKGRNY
jgi:hypothetical protein